MGGVGVALGIFLATQVVESSMLRDIYVLNISLGFLTLLALDIHGDYHREASRILINKSSGFPVFPKKGTNEDSCLDASVLQAPHRTMIEWPEGL